jgi:hypothetical protein
MSAIEVPVIVLLIDGRRLDDCQDRSGHTQAGRAFDVGAGMKKGDAELIEAIYSTDDPQADGSAKRMCKCTELDGITKHRVTELTAEVARKSRGRGCGGSRGG